jgi:peptidoglycan/xylan/chitin deacetylase (PgdA/CDA1 family)
MIFLAIIPIFLILALCFYIIIPSFFNVLIRRRFLSRIRRSGFICLTFDDGPDPFSTPKILEALEHAGAKATFFLVGQRAERYPDLVNRILAGGHEIGEHSFSHLHPWKTWPFRYIKDLQKGGRSLEPYLSPKKSVVFRPPYGKMNMAGLIYVWFGGKQVAFWNIDPKDYQEDSAQKITEVIIDNLGPGSVILLHDGRRSLSDNAYSTTEAVRRILKKIGNREKVLATISQGLSQS